jgi:TonB family protein
MKKNFNILIFLLTIQGFLCLCSSQPNSKKNPRVQEMPLFMGEDISSDKFRKFMIDNFVYPETAIKDQINGKVIASFMVDTSGKVTNIKIVKSLCSDLDNETIRVLSNSPLWIPGKINGKPVNVVLTYPFVFTNGQTDSIKGSNLKK